MAHFLSPKPTKTANFPGNFQQLEISENTSFPKEFPEILIWANWRYPVRPVGARDPRAVLARGPLGRARDVLCPSLVRG